MMTVNPTLPKYSAAETQVKLTIFEYAHFTGVHLKLTTVSQQQSLPVHKLQEILFS